MKKIIILISALLVSLTSQADFIESGYLYGLEKRHYKMVDNGGDIYLGLIQQDHGKFVDSSKLAYDVADDWSGLMGRNVIKLKKGKKGMEQLVGLLDPHSEPYYCYPMQLDTNSSIDGDVCEKNLRKLLGDAILKADDVRFVDIWGDYYGDYNVIMVIISDFETKETATLELPIYHDI